VFSLMKPRYNLHSKFWLSLTSFLLNVVAESVSKESKVTKEERIAQVTAKLMEYSLIVGVSDEMNDIE